MVTRQRAPGAYILLGFLVLAICVSTGAAVLEGVNASKSSAIQNGTRVVATVDQVLETQGTGFQLSVVYSADGHSYSKSISYKTDAAKPPSSVMMVYRSSDPVQAEVLGQPRFSSSSATGFATSAALFLILAAFLFWRIRRQPSSRSG